MIGGPSVGSARDRSAVFLPTLEGGGAERAMINLARGMAAIGHTVHLVVGDARGPYRREVGGDVELVDLSAGRALAALPGLVRYLRRARPHRLYSALEEANILALWARRLARVPVEVVPGLRNTLSSELRDGGGAKTRVMLALARRLYPQADGIVAVSAAVADDAANLLKLPRERIAVISNPTITPELMRDAQAPLDHPWFRAGESPVVLGCGRLGPQKDFATLVHAFAAVRARRPARLLVLGDGPQRDELLRLARDLGVGDDVALPGFDANPFRYMARAAVFALSSIYEGSPNVLVQALACGSPVVATDCPGGSREILSGVSATRLVAPRDAAGLAQALDTFLGPSVERPGPRLLAAFDYRTAATAYAGLGR